MPRGGRWAATRGPFRRRERQRRLALNVKAARKIPNTPPSPSLVRRILVCGTPASQAVLAKPEAFDPASFLGKHEDPFKAIVPPSVLEAATELCSMQDAILQKCKADGTENADLARALLASLGLPAAVEACSVRAGSGTAPPASRGNAGRLATSAVHGAGKAAQRRRGRHAARAACCGGLVARAVRTRRATPAFTLRRPVAPMQAEEGGNGISNTMWNKIAEVQRKGGIDELKKLMADAAKVRTSLHQELAKVQQLLEAEQREDGPSRGGVRKQPPLRAQPRAHRRQPDPPAAAATTPSPLQRVRAPPPSASRPFRWRTPPQASAAPSTARAGAATAPRS